MENTSQPQDTPNEDLRELVRLGLDAIVESTDPMQAELRDIAPQVVARLRDKWMDAFVQEMCAELKARNTA